ncbi:MAG: hypothetical protein ACLFUJ_06340 [Phycisphaerae bacterium]
MKSLPTLLLLLILVFGPGCARTIEQTHTADIWVSPRGDDAAEGTKQAPLQTIQAAADKLEPGQTCLVLPGTYYESVKPTWSGRDDAPIRFIAPAEAVVISGTPIENWTAGPDNVWTAETKVHPKQLFVADGDQPRPLTWARYPDDSGDPWNPNVLVLNRKQEQLAVGPGLDQPAGTWKGAHIWAIDDQRGWVAEVNTVTESQPGQVSLERPKGWWPVGGRGYVILMGVRPALDAPGEWLYIDGRIHLVCAEGQDPNEQTYFATDDGHAFDLAGRKHVGIEGFQLVGSRINFDGAEHCWAANVNAVHLTSGRDLRKGFCRDGGTDADSQGLGIVLGGRSNEIRNSRIDFSAGDGVSIFGENNAVRNCVISNCSTLATDCAPITVTGRGHTIEHNTLYNGGRSILVHRYLKAGRIAHNHMYNSGLLSRDLGMTYTYHTDGEGTEIAYNVIHHNFAPGNGGCVGIYLDDRSQNHVVHHNVVYQVNEALALNPPENTGNKIYNNTFSAFSRTVSMSLKRPQNLEGTVIRNNIFLAEVMPAKHMPNVTIDTNIRPGTDPKLAAPAERNYQLTSGSPAIDAGKVLPPWTDGYLGEAPDIGAFEFGKEPWRYGAPHAGSPGMRQIDLKGRRKHEWKLRAVEKWE